MHDGTYIGTLRKNLRCQRALATWVGKFEQEIEEAYDAHDIESALSWERALAEVFNKHRPLANTLLKTAILFGRAGVKMPNPRWVIPPWLRQEWQAISDEWEIQLDDPATLPRKLIEAVEEQRQS